MVFQPFGRFKGQPPLFTPNLIKADNIIGGTITAEELIIAGGTQGIIRSQNYDGTSAGWAIFGDGTAKFFGDVTLGANAIVLGDVYSNAWDGTIPANLATFDSGASVGFYLDSSAGAAQFSGDLFVGGKIISTDGVESIEIDPAGWGGTQASIKFAVGATSQQPEITGANTDGALFLSGGGAVNNTQIKVSGGIPRIDLEVDGADRLRITTTRIDLRSVSFLGLPVKTSSGDPSSPAEGDMYVNTNTNQLRLRADSAWHTVFSW